MSLSPPDVILIDSVIDQLLSTGGVPAGRTMADDGTFTAFSTLSQPFTEATIKRVVALAVDLVASEPCLVRLPAPVKIVGDIHGQFEDLKRIFIRCGLPCEGNTSKVNLGRGGGEKEPSSSSATTDASTTTTLAIPSSSSWSTLNNFLFLGDYVNRGKQGIECILLLLALKLRVPKALTLLRGNHECASITRIYGFYDECKRRYNLKIWKCFHTLFNLLPVAAVVEEKIFCVHGGLSPELKTLSQIEKIMRPTDVPDTGLLCDLLWADPDEECRGWGEQDKGVSYLFGPSVINSFLDRHDMDLICRAHQVVEEGYSFMNNRTLVTIFSAPNYCGEFDNHGAVMAVNEDLQCSFIVLASRGWSSTSSNSRVPPFL